MTLVIQEFNINFLDRLGRENIVTYFLSRLNNEGEVVFVEDDFPDENIFDVFVNYFLVCIHRQLFIYRKDSNTFVS